MRPIFITSKKPAPALCLLVPRCFSVLLGSLVLATTFFGSNLYANSNANDEGANPASMRPSSFHPGAVRKGFYTGLSTGRLMYTSSERNLYKDGWVVGFKAGYDLWRYLGLEGLFKFSAHSSTTGSTLANTPASFFVYQAIGQLRGAYPILNRLYIQGAAGGGLYMSSPNQNSLYGSGRGMIYGELGLEYFMRSRGISVGLDPSFAFVQNFDGMILQATGFLRYTF